VCGIASGVDAMPLISVIVPTYNRAELLKQALRSVLDQADADFEVIVSDNCSSDHTPEVMAAFQGDSRVLYSRNTTNLGMIGNWRHAIHDLARGEWFMLMSDDDHLIDRSYLQKACAAIAEHQPRFIYSGARIEDRLSGKVETLLLPFDGLVPGEAVFASRGSVKPLDFVLATAVFRRVDVRRLAFLDDPDNLSCDSEFYLKLCCEGKVFAIPTPACVYVKHGGNLAVRINTTRRLLAHNVRHVVNPLAYARLIGIPEQAQNSFRTNARLDEYIAFTLLKLWLHDESWYRECRDGIAAALPDVLCDVESSVEYRSKRMLIAALRPLLRKLFPLRETAPGAL
jgi:glycosyltransferase involved in cell wall biosynthesis